MSEVVNTGKAIALIRADVLLMLSNYIEGFYKEISSTHRVYKDSINARLSDEWIRMILSECSQQTTAQETQPSAGSRGTEFVFLKKTEAQELALATRRNTRQNKGDAMLPKYTLQILAEQTTDSEATSEDNKSARDSSRRCASAKRASWNDERLVEYEGESGEGSSDDAAGGGRTKPVQNKPLSIKGQQNRPTRRKQVKGGQPEGAQSDERTRKRPATKKQTTEEQTRNRQKKTLSTEEQSIRNTNPIEVQKLSSQGIKRKQSDGKDKCPDIAGFLDVHDRVES
ncbi:hypothetical protein BDV33DRAFT_210463 [Aspergillus novoparasiticus]|uniref:Uncharacterized protein n=1 Tax=Aspergillus novoparasiticus TaxID=986946 RepID=A0A5N6E6G4_9EURO|nr:hypothetical protein BDV33DRAFT_210463 [Aspergillus novoparasiticus]